eukprot:46724-Eustigmatos_ZCMA.PRE.1
MHDYGLDLQAPPDSMPARIQKHAAMPANSPFRALRLGEAEPGHYRGGKRHAQVDPHALRDVACRYIHTSRPAALACRHYTRCDRSAAEAYVGSEYRV